MAEFAVTHVMAGVQVLLQARAGGGWRRLLGGPEPEIASFCHALNAAPPATERALRAMLLDLIEASADCAFAPLDLILDQEAADAADALRRDGDRRARDFDHMVAQGRLDL